MTAEAKQIFTSIRDLQTTTQQFETLAYTTMHQIKERIDVENNGETLTKLSESLNKIYKTVEDLSSELYLTSLSVRGRLTYLQKE